MTPPRNTGQARSGSEQDRRGYECGARRWQRFGARLVTGREAPGHGRERLWARWRETDKSLDGYAAHRATQAAVVVHAPRSVVWRNGVFHSLLA